LDVKEAVANPGYSKKREFVGLTKLQSVVVKLQSYFLLWREIMGDVRRGLPAVKGLGFFLNGSAGCGDSLVMA
jgi:hypothetical protein